jgi:hypothetical protein
MLNRARERGEQDLKSSTVAWLRFISARYLAPR